MNIIESLSPLLVPIDSIRPDPRNVRRHPERNIEAIKESLTVYGQRKPIITNQGIIEAGNGLWLAAKELGWAQIAAVQVDDDPAHAKAYSIMDNQSALLADWDLPILKDVLEGLNTGAFDMEATGFTGEEIEKVMANLGELKYFAVLREASPVFGIRVGVVTSTRWKKGKGQEFEDYQKFLDWKAGPSGYPELTNEMAEDVSGTLRSMFADWRGFIITVPPQGVSHGSEYPAGFLGKQVAANLGVDFVTIFERDGDDAKRWHHPLDSWREGCEPYRIVKDMNQPIVIVDDAITSGMTARRCLASCHDKLVFFVAWIKNQGRK